MAVGALVNLAQAGQGLVICEQKECPTLQVELEVLNTTKSTLHFEQKRDVVFLEIGELPSGILDCKMISFFCDLREDCPSSPGVLHLLHWRQL